MIGAGQGPLGKRSTVRREVRAQRAGADRATYGATRDEFREGDVLLFRGLGPMSMLIRLLTRSPYSHVGLVHLYEERVYCLEAVGAGVRLMLMSEVMRRYHGGIDYYALQRASEVQRRGAVSFGFQQLGKIYDRPGLVRFAVAILFGRKPSAREDQSWFCSELVAAAYRRQDLPLAPASATYTSPADLALSPELKLRWVLKREE